MYETCNDFLMKMYMASFTKLMNTWKFVCKFEWWKLFLKKVNCCYFSCLKIWKSAHFIMSQVPLHSCHLIWKDAMHSWKNTIWNMFKNQKKSCTGSLGTGSDTGRTRFLVNVITHNSKISRRNRFPYWYNPVPGTNSRDIFLNKFWNPVPC